MASESIELNTIQIQSIEYNQIKITTPHCRDGNASRLANALFVYQKGEMTRRDCAEMIEDENSMLLNYFIPNLERHRSAVNGPYRMVALTRYTIAILIQKFGSLHHYCSHIEVRSLPTPQRFSRLA